MQRVLPTAAVCLALVFGLPAWSVAAAAMPQYPRQSAVDAIAGAQSALAQGRGIAALTDTENAETLLLNGQQAGAVAPERTLTALARADSDLQYGGYAAAAAALHTAAVDLG
jgi:hypothetical protein